MMIGYFLLMLTGAVMFLVLTLIVTSAMCGLFRIQFNSDSPRKAPVPVFMLCMVFVWAATLHVCWYLISSTHLFYTLLVESVR